MASTLADRPAHHGVGPDFSFDFPILSRVIAAHITQLPHIECRVTRYGGSISKMTMNPESSCRFENDLKILNMAFES